MNFLCSFYLDYNARIKIPRGNFFKDDMESGSAKKYQYITCTKQKPARMLWYQREDKEILS